MIKTLLGCGVDTIFGYPGNYVLDIYDELYSHRAKIRHVETCHEQHACHAADGYARASGKTGVVLATSGPGATNLVTGIASAYMDSVPLVAITGNVPAAILGKDNFQEVDIAGITMPITKHNFIVKSTGELEETLVRAFEIAGSGRKGPVLVDLPHDVVTGRADFQGLFPDLPADRLAEHSEVERTAELIRRASRPLLLAGGGMRSERAAAALAGFLGSTGIPAVATMAGLSAVAGSENLGMAGIYGSARANRAIAQADLLLAVGTRFSDRVTDALPAKLAAKIVHVDLDRAELGKNVRAELGICADAADFLERLAACDLPTFHERGKSFGQTVSEQSASTMFQKISQTEVPNVWDAPLSKYAPVLDAVRKLGDSVNLATDVGLHQVYAAKNFPFHRGDRFVSSCGLGAMGFGLGAAIGAYLANGLPTVLITGDGSFRMNLTELCTAARLRLPLTVVVFNNRSLGMVRRLQENNFGGRVFETSGTETDFSAVARAFGAESERAETPERAAELILSRRNAQTPFVVDLSVD